jgi:hypothetical protein
MFLLNLMIYSGFTLAAAFSPGLWWLAVFRFCAGIGLGAELTLADAVWELAASYDDERRVERVRSLALGASTQASGLAEDARDLRLAELVAQVRSVGVDLVRAAERVSGVEQAPRTDELLNT